MDAAARPAPDTSRRPSSSRPSARFWRRRSSPEEARAASALATVGLGALIAAAIGLVAALRGILPVARLDRAGSLAVVAARRRSSPGRGSRSPGRSRATARGSGSGAGSSTSRSSPSGCSPGRSSPARGGSPRSMGVVLGAALGWALLGVAIPVALRGRRPDRAAPRAGRILERPRAPRRRCARVRRSGSSATRAPGSRRRSAARLRGGARAAPDAVARRASSPVSLVLVLWLVLSDGRLEDGLRRRSSPSRRSSSSAGPSRVRRSSRWTRSATTGSPTAGSSRSSPLTGAVVAVAGLWLVPVRRLVAERRRAVAGACARRRGRRARRGGRRRRRGRQPVRLGVVAGSGGECENDPGRLTDLCANNRLAWWGEALEIAADRPVGGTGAGTFAIARRQVRDDATTGSEPHSVPLQLLADTGVVGLGLGLLFAAAAVVGVRRGLRLVPADERAAAAALACLAPRVRRPRARRLRPRLPRRHRTGARRARRAARRGAAAGFVARPAPGPARGRRRRCGRRRSCSCCRRSPTAGSSVALAASRRGPDRRGGRRGRSRAAPQSALARSARRARDRGGRGGRPRRGRRVVRGGDASSSPRTRTPGTPWASTTRSRPGTSAPRTRR